MADAVVIGTQPLSSSSVQQGISSATVSDVSMSSGTIAVTPVPVEVDAKPVILWDGDAGVYKVNTESEDSGYWFTWNDNDEGGLSKISFPVEMGNEYSEDQYDAVIDYCSGFCGTVYFDGPIPNPSAGAAFSVADEGQYADISEWRGTIVVVAPVSCSVSEDHVSAGTQITFSGEANTSYGAQANSCGIKVNGNWLEHSNATGSEYLMLNLFANQSGYLEAQLCTSSGNCLNALLEKNNYPASVSVSNMIMMAATLTTDSKLNVSAFTGDYYGTNPRIPPMCMVVIIMIPMERLFLVIRKNQKSL